MLRLCCADYERSLDRLERLAAVTVRTSWRGLAKGWGVGGGWVGWRGVGGGGGGQGLAGGGGGGVFFGAPFQTHAPEFPYPMSRPTMVHWADLPKITLMY